MPVAHVAGNADPAALAAACRAPARSAVSVGEAVPGAQADALGVCGRRPRASDSLGEHAPELGREDRMAGGAGQLGDPESCFADRTFPDCGSTFHEDHLLSLDNIDGYIKIVKLKIEYIH